MMFNDQIDSNITGFLLLPEYESMRNGTKKLRKLNFELLKDGDILLTGSYNEINEEQLKRFQTQLLKMCMFNLDIAENFEQIERQAELKRNLDIVNMFKINVLEGDNMVVEITFIKSGYFATKASFWNVSKAKIKEIREILKNNLPYNMTCSKQCEAVSYLDLLAIIDQKVHS